MLPGAGGALLKHIQIRHASRNIERSGELRRRGTALGVGSYVGPGPRDLQRVEHRRRQSADGQRAILPVAGGCAGAADGLCACALADVRHL